MAHENTWEAQGVVKRFTGFLTATELVRATEEVGADPRFGNLRFIVNDFLSVGGNDIDEETVLHIAALHAGAAFTNPNILIAYVATDIELAALAGRVKEALFSEKHIMKAFTTMDDARAWLDSQPLLYSSLSHSRMRQR
jgi:hypothetical protein